MNPEPLPYLIDRQPPDSNHTIPYQVVKATSVYRVRREEDGRKLESRLCCQARCFLWGGFAGGGLRGGMMYKVAS